MDFFLSQSIKSDKLKVLFPHGTSVTVCDGLAACLECFSVFSQSILRSVPSPLCAEYKYVTSEYFMYIEFPQGYLSPQGSHIKPKQNAVELREKFDLKH